MPTDILAAQTNLTHMFLLQDYEVKLQEIQALQEEKKVHCTQYNWLMDGALLIILFLPQEYEAKLAELESALLKQLQTDTAVEKLEEQRKVLMYMYKHAFMHGDTAQAVIIIDDHIFFFLQEFMMKLEELETTLAQKHLEVRRSSAKIIQCLYY